MGNKYNSVSDSFSFICPSFRREVFVFKPHSLLLSVLVLSLSIIQVGGICYR